MKFAVILFFLASLFSFTDLFVTSQQEDELIPSRLLEGAKDNDIELVLRAIEDGENIDTQNDNGWSAAFFAVSNGNIELLRALIDHGIDLNAQNSEGHTVTMIAAAQRDKEILELLLNSNADPTIKGPEEVNAYVLAKDSHRLINAALILESCILRGMINNDPDLIVEAIQEGGYVNMRSPESGWNPVIYAAVTNNPQLLRSLIELGADVNHVENDGWSALHFAAYDGFEEVASILIDAGIDTFLQNIDGESAIWLSQDQGHEAISKMISAKELSKQQL